MRYDAAERVHSNPLPFLFQLQWGVIDRVIAAPAINSLIETVCKNANVRGNDGARLRFTAHDFRRIFATETVAAGLPVHISEFTTVDPSGNHIRIGTNT